MVAEFYGHRFSQDQMTWLTESSNIGTSLYSLKQAAIRLGFKSEGVRACLRELKQQTSFPSILYWQRGHFVVLFGITEEENKTTYHVADPAQQIVRLEEEKFASLWLSDQATGILLILEPTV